MPTYEPFDWYQTPVYYDIIYDTDTKKDATFLEACCARHATYGQDAKPQSPPKPAVSATADAAESNRAALNRPLAILEPACGSGRLMAELATRGHRVAGLDLSKGMLDFARRRLKHRGVTGKLIKAPMQDFDLSAFIKPPSGSTSGGGFDLAHILVSSFKYLQTEDDAAACIRRVCDHLRVGGVFVLGIHLTDPNDGNRYLERWRAQRDGIDVTCTVRTSPPDHANRTEKLRSRIVARKLNRPDAEPKRYETNWSFRTYSPGQLKSLIRKEPRFNHCATYTFDHDISMSTSLDGDDLGVVLVLRRDH